MTRSSHLLSLAVSPFREMDVMKSGIADQFLAVAGRVSCNYHASTIFALLNIVLLVIIWADRRVAVGKHGGPA